jgi:hypothetical protein
LTVGILQVDMLDKPPGSCGQQPLQAPKCCDSRELECGALEQLAYGLSISACFLNLDRL